MPSCPSGGGGNTRLNGFDVNTMKARNATPIIAWIDKVRAFKPGGRLRPNAATAAPNSARMKAHSTIEPSWFPHEPLTL